MKKHYIVSFYQNGIHPIEYRSDKSKKETLAECRSYIAEEYKKLKNKGFKKIGNITKDGYCSLVHPVYGKDCTVYFQEITL